jgi:signal transduction histidine kinase
MASIADRIIKPTCRLIIMSLSYHEAPSKPTPNPSTIASTITAPNADLLFNPDWLSGTWSLGDWVVELCALLNVQNGLVLHMMDDQDIRPHYWAWSPATGYLEAVTQLPATLPQASALVAIPLLIQGQWAGQLMLWDDVPESRLDGLLPLLALSIQLTRIQAQQQRLRLERLLLTETLHQTYNSPEGLVQNVLDLLSQHLALQGAAGVLVSNKQPFGQLSGELPVLWYPLLYNQQWLGAIGVQAPHWTENVYEALSLLCQSVSHRLAEHLAHQALGKQTETLRQTIDTLQATQLQLIQSEKLAVVGQFVAGIAHEVNTPLAAVYSNTQLLQQLTLPLGEQAKPLQGLLAMNIQACQRMDQTVKNLKAFARLDQAKEKSPVAIWHSVME